MVTPNIRFRNFLPACGLCAIAAVLPVGDVRAADGVNAQAWSVVVDKPLESAGPESFSYKPAPQTVRETNNKPKAEKAKKTSAPKRDKPVPGPYANTSLIETGSVDQVNAVVAASPKAAPVPASDSSGLDDKSSTARKFCINIKPQLEEMRIAFQRKSLSEVESEMEKRMTLLDSKIKEYKQWIERRQEFSSKAQDTLVKIYAKMRPDAAAQQLAAVDIETAAAVVLKLDPRASSAILNDMDPKLAATLAATIAGAARVDDAATKPPAAAP